MLDKRFVLLLFLLGASSFLSVRLFFTSEPREEDGFTIHSLLAVDTATASSIDIVSSRICIVIDGVQCGCEDGRYVSSSAKLNELCLDLRQAALASKSMYSIALQIVGPARWSAEQTKPERVPNRTISTSPTYIGPNVSVRERLITLVLPLTLDDLSRACVLMQSLQEVQSSVVKEMLIIVPTTHELAVTGALNGLAAVLGLRFPVRVISEDRLFTSLPDQRLGYYSYAIQMAVKLLVAQLVTTPYYLTLDADVVLLRGFSIDSLLVSVDGAKSSSKGDSTADDEPTEIRKALYHWEARSVHEAWWEGSERVLNISAATSYPYFAWQQTAHTQHCDANTQECSDPSLATGFNAQQRAIQGFGVTPALLSTYGSQLTVSHVCRSLTANYDPLEPIDRALCEQRWLGGFSRRYADILGNVGSSDGDTDGLEEDVMLWSEYTLYRVVLDHYEVFDELHISEQDAAQLLRTQHNGEGASSAGPRLHCHNVWYASQLPWRADLASREEGCLFSVVQSTSGVAPSTVFKQYMSFFDD